MVSGRTTALHRQLNCSKLLRSLALGLTIKIIIVYLMDCAKQERGFTSYLFERLPHMGMAPAATFYSITIADGQLERASDLFLEMEKNDPGAVFYNAATQEKRILQFFARGCILRSSA